MPAKVTGRKDAKNTLLFLSCTNWLKWSYKIFTCSLQKDVEDAKKPELNPVLDYKEDKASRYPLLFVHPLTLDKCKIRILIQWLLRRSLQNSDIFASTTSDSWSGMDYLSYSYHCQLSYSQSGCYWLLWLHTNILYCCCFNRLSSWTPRFAQSKKLKQLKEKYSQGYFRAAPLNFNRKSWIVINCSDCTEQQQEL